MMQRYLLLLALLCTYAAQASNIEVYQFDDPNQEEDYKELVAELRCLVCQNQNIADSNAELAQDMRHKTYNLLKQGMSKNEIADYMADRYGDFVLYRPRFKASTAVLWIGPFVLLAIGIALMLRTIALRRRVREADALSEASLREAADLLSNPNPPDDKTS